MTFRPLIIAISLLFAIACESTPNSTTTQGREVSIAYLKSLCTGDHYRIVDDYTIRGTVVATDWLGELYNCAIMTDETGSLEFAIKSQNISEHLPIFADITIACNGLMLARIGGKVELGLPPTGEFPLDEISDDNFNRYINIVGINQEIEVATKQFSEITASDIGRLVRFDNVRILHEEPKLSWCNIIDGVPETTFRTLIDSNGDTFDMRILASCHYAKEEMPTQEISVIGVIDYSDNRYFLRIVNKAIIE